MASPMSCRIGLRSRPSIGAGLSRANGFEVIRMNRKNAAPTMPWTDSTLACRVAGRLRPNAATRAPNSVRISTHNSIEPS
jgi:hypothetical protein